jgi:small-conductance mechanosensitive channel
MSKFMAEEVKEVKTYRDLLANKKFIIFIRFVVYALVPVIVTGKFLDHYFETYTHLGDQRIYTVLILFDTFEFLLIVYVIISTYFIKEFGLIPSQMIESTKLKLRLYLCLVLSGFLCIINDIDIVNRVASFRSMVYPDGAALLNLVVGTLFCITLFTIVPYINTYFRYTKGNLVFKKLLILFMFLWALGTPFLMFLGASNLPIEFDLKVVGTLALLFFCRYLYLTVRDFIPLVINSVRDSFTRSGYYSYDEKEHEIIHEGTKRHNDGAALSQYWITLAAVIAVSLLFLFELLSIWGVPYHLMSDVADFIFFKKISVAGRSTFSLSLLLMSIASGFLVYYFFKIIQFVFETRIFPYTRFDDGTRHAIKTAIGYIGLLSSLILAIYVLGINMTALTFIISGLSVGIGFSMQELFKNFFSGFVLLIERPIKIGDILTIDGQPAKVKKIKIRCTILESNSRDIIVIPNSDLINHKVINETTFPLSRIEIEADVSYEEDPARVAKILKEVSDSHQQVSKTFKSIVEFARFNEYSVTLLLKAFVKRHDKDVVMSDIKFMIFKAYKDNNISMCDNPVRDVFIKEMAQSGGIEVKTIDHNKLG